MSFPRLSEIGQKIHVGTKQRFPVKSAGRWAISFCRGSPSDHKKVNRCSERRAAGISLISSENFRSTVPHLENLSGCAAPILIKKFSATVEKCVEHWTDSADLFR